MSRAGVQSVMLLLIGGTLVKIAWTGTYVRYVKAGLHWYLLAAGAVLAAVAAANLVRLFWIAGRQPVHEAVHHDDGHGDDRHGDDRHGHAHRGFEPSWLLIAPALVLLLVVPPALGSYAASRGGTALSASTGSEFPPLPDGDPVRISMLDYASRAVFDQGHTLGERRITMSGFVMAAGDKQYLARMVITCCAADARPVKVGLTGDVPAARAEDSWLEVTGTYTPQTDTDPIDNEPIPYLTVTEAHPVPAPKQPYES